MFTEGSIEVDYDSLREVKARIMNTIRDFSLCLPPRSRMRLTVKEKCDKGVSQAKDTNCCLNKIQIDFE